MAICHKCGEVFHPDMNDLDADGYPAQTKLCYHCFEEGVEAADERRRERIARENEY